MLVTLVALNLTIPPLSLGITIPFSSLVDGLGRTQTPLPSIALDLVSAQQLSCFV